MNKITNDFKNKILSDDEYEYLYNYDISEKINILNDFTYIINWIFKTFNKYFLNISDVETNDELKPLDYKLLNEYFEIQKNIKIINGKKSSDELYQFINNNKSSKKL